jgi:Tol biopolymer transport system component
MYHSLIGKPSLRVGLVMGLLIGLCVLLLAACGGQKSTSGGSASTDSRIVFHRYLDPAQPKTKSAIFTMYPNGSHIRQITHPPKGWSDRHPAWSPDGTKVAFHRGCHSGLFRRPSHCHGSRILVVDVNTGFTRSVTHCIPNRGWTKENPPPSSAPYCVRDSHPTFSPDGKSIAFRRVIGPEDESSRVEGIFMVGLDGSGPHQVSNVDKRGALEFEDFGPAFSPDGKLLVFERSRLEDDRHAVFVQSLDSSGSPEDARQITPWEMYCGDGPEFSPNANWVLFGCEPEGEAIEELYWVHPNGTGLYRLTYAPDDVHYEGSSFSPEFKGWGDIVAVRWPASGDYDNSDVFRMHIEFSDVQSEETVNLTKSQTLDDAPSWGTYPQSARQ